MRIALTALLLVTGCDEVFSLDREDAGTPGDAIDAVDAPLSLCFGGQYTAGGVFEHCFAAPPIERLVVGPSIDTDRVGSGDCMEVILQTDQAETEVCMIAADRIEINAGVRAEGARPLVLIARTDLVIAGDLDASSRRGVLRNGAGAGASCGSRRGTNSTGAGGAGGGGGGAYGSAGGKGGDGPGGANGAPQEVASTFGFIRGGCGGGSGGDGLIAGTPGGRGGRSGGAIYLIAGGTVSITGSINVSGEAGRGGAIGTAGHGAGGGGGGSGGLIAIDAGAIVLGENARLIANGAGAGGGGGSTGAGGDGFEVDLIGGTYPYPTPGGDPGAAGGSNAGGGGHTESLPGGPGANATGGAGGGGGGVGHVRLFSPARTVDGAEISPPFVAVP